MATPKYVAIDAAGGGDGSNRTTQAWTVPEALNQLTANDLCYVVHHSLNGDGSPSGLSAYPETATATAANSGSAVGGMIRFVGLDSSDNIATSLGAGPVFDYSGLGAGNAFYGNLKLYWLIWGIRVINAPSHGIYRWGIADIVLCEANDNGGYGINTFNVDCTVAFSRTTGNANHGIYTENENAQVVGNKSYSNTGDDIRIGEKGIAILNYMKRTVTGSALHLGQSAKAYFNTIIGTGAATARRGINQTSFSLMIANNVSGLGNASDVALQISAKIGAEWANNLYNNTADHSATPEFDEEETAIDPALPDEANNVFSPIAASLAHGFGEGHELSIGAGQGEAGIVVSDDLVKGIIESGLWGG
jgi:hypothetical protein